MLIPSRGCANHTVTYFVVACAERAEAQKVARNIQEQLEQHEQMQNFDLHPNISICLVEATECHTGEPFERIAQELTRRAGLVATAAFEGSHGHDR